MSVSFTGIPLDYVTENWEVFRAYVVKGLNASDAHLDYSPEDILELIKSKDVQVWAAYKEANMIAVFLTRIAIYPRRKVLELFLASGGGLPSWVNGVYDVMVAFGKSNGCDGMRAYGRQGWERLYRSRAHTTKTFIMGVEI